MARPGLIRRFFGGLWTAVDFSRRLVINLLFLLIVGLVLFVWLSSDKPPRLSPDTALVLNIQGDVVEEYTVGAQEAAISEALGRDRFETRVRDILAALDGAARDPQITRVVLVLDEMGSVGLATLRELGAAVERVRGAGKPVVAWSESYTQGQYFLAAHADEVFLHPSGAVLIRGIGGVRGYYKDLLDKLGVKVNTFQAGRYKSFGEPFTRTGPTPEAQEAEAFLLNGLWSTWLADVERLRKLKAGSVMAAINDLPQRLLATQGDIAQLALNEKLIDGLKRRDEFRALMLERGAPRSRDDDETFRQISMYSYLRYVDTPRTGAAVAVVVAQGEIVDGDDRPGTIGARAASELIQRARQDDDIKALVVRIDSPGGSASASELIREQLELTRKAGKPVVVSMGDVAASGGYWIAMGGDEVIADAATITGSIGVFALIPTFTGTMEKLGVNTAGAATTWIAESTDLTRPLDKRLAQVIEAGIGHTYSEFLDVVANNRQSTPEKINEVAQGRVWSGAQARERGLVDSVGGLDLAVKSAARRAGLGDGFRVEYLEHEPRGLDRYLALFFGQLGATLRNDFGWDTLARALTGTVAPRAPLELRLLLEAKDQPMRALSYCFCEVR
ncbi:MAG TPA: signal peptide peptidase SppA [Burkholderiaceae bacterium]|nr:signal peptide peptidase SppA [Burkholderiaceae bacterium]